MIQIHNHMMHSKNRHPDFSTLAARISVSNLHKQTSKSFIEVVEILYNHVHPKTGQASALVSEQLYNVRSNLALLDIITTNTYMITPTCTRSSPVI